MLSAPSPPRHARGRRRRPARFVLALALLAAGPPAAAQHGEGGARAIALGRAGVALGGEAWGTRNPAAWAGLAGPTLGIEATRPFGLGELTAGAATAAYPASVGVGTLSARAFGADGYRETRLAVGFARSVALSRSRTLDVGVAVGYDGLSIDGFGSTGSVLVSAGVQGEAVPGLRVGLGARNVGGFFRDAEADLRQPLSAVPAIAVGLAYRAAPEATLVLDAEQDLEAELSVRAGLEVRPVAPLALRLGVGTAPVRLSGGLGVLAGPLRADVAVERHEELGVTPAVSIQIGL